MIRRFLRPLFRGAVLLLASVALSGCTSTYLAYRMTRAPNQAKTPKALQEFETGFDRTFYSFTTRIHVAPDPADLSVGILEPGDYKLKYDLKITDHPQEGKEDLSISFGAVPLDKAAAPVSPRGTIVLLHGVMMTKESMFHWAFFLAQKGYRIVLVDLRGHGRSTGSVITFGARETGDLTQVLDALAQRGLVAGRVGVLGISYGGAIAIQWAAREPRIAAVVALEPFCDAREAIDEFAHAIMPKLTAHISKEAMAKAFVLAAQRGGFTWDQVDVLAAARQLRQPLLLFHGRNDTWIPISHSERLRAAAPAGSRLETGPGNHITLSLRLDPISGPVAEWFDRGLVSP